MVDRTMNGSVDQTMRASVSSFVSVICAFISFLVLVGVGTADGQGGETNSSKVKVDVYYESLCPDSRHFIINQFYPTWKDLSHIMMVDLNAYGKAREEEDGDQTPTCHCQHGPSECQGNKMLTCAKKYMPDVNDFIAFSNCIMTEFQGSTSGRDCAQQIDVDLNETETCSQGTEGPELLHDVGLVQSALNPPLDYVPWILINDEYTRDLLWDCQEDLRKVVCDAYKGPKPQGCPFEEDGGTV